MLTNVLALRQLKRNLVSVLAKEKGLHSLPSSQRAYAIWIALGKVLGILRQNVERLCIDAAKRGASPPSGPASMPANS